MRRNSFEDQLRRLFVERESKAQTVKPIRVVGRNTDGSEIHQLMDGTCPQRGDGNNALGQIVVLPTAPVADRQSLGLPTPRIIGGLVAGLKRQDPRILRRGSTNRVMIYGRGDVLKAQVQYLLEGETPHPGLTVTQVNPLPLSQLEVYVDVHPSAPLATGMPVAYGLTGGLDAAANPTALPQRAEDWYDIAAPLAPAKYLALYRTDAGVLTLVRHTADGISLGPSNPGLSLPGFAHGPQPYEGSHPWAVPMPVPGGNLVHPDSLIWIDTSGRLNVTDFEVATTYTYTPPSGGAVVGAYEKDTRVIWVEWYPPTGASAAAVPVRMLSRQKNLEDEAEIVLAETTLGGGISVTNWACHAAGFTELRFCLLCSHRQADEDDIVLNTAWDNNGDNQQSYGYYGTTDQRGTALPIGLLSTFAAVRGDWRWGGGAGGESGGGWESSGIVPSDPEIQATVLDGSTLPPLGPSDRSVAIGIADPDQPTPLYEGLPLSGSQLLTIDLQPEPGLGRILSAFIIDT